MLVYYTSLSGNVRRFLARLPKDFEARDIKTNPVANEPFIFVTYTFGFGQVPAQAAKWLNENGRHMIGVASSGNRNWGDNFAKAGDLIARKYDVPLLLKFELSGTAQNSAEFIRKAAELYDNVLRVE